MRRRWVFCSLILLLLYASSAEASAMLCFHVNGLSILTDENGHEQISAGEYDDIFTVREGQLFAAGNDGRYGLVDATGTRLGDIAFSMIDDQTDALIYREGALYGAMDAQGHALIPVRWTQLTVDGRGGFLALESDPFDEQSDEILHIDSTGKARRTGVFTMSGLQRVSCDRMVYLSEGGTWGAINGYGAVAIQPQWRYLGAFQSNTAKATGPEGVGMIDTLGRSVIQTVYRWLERGLGFVVAWDGEGVDVFGPRGGARRCRLRGRAGEIAVVGSCVWICRGERTFLYDLEGRLLKQSTAGSTFAPGTRGQIILCEGEWGETGQRLLNSDGTTASSAFQQLLPLCTERYAYMRMRGIRYDSAELGDPQTSWDYEGRTYGLVDRNGRILLPADYVEIRALSEDRLLLIGEDTATLADRNGRAIKTWPLS